MTVREKKKNKKFKETTRAVDMSPLLREVMRDWLGRHPASPFTFCQTEVVGRSKKRSKTTGHKSGPDRPTTLGGRAAGIRAREDRPTIGPLTKDEANHHFHKALAGTRWAVIRGFHTFRHTCASLLFAGGKNVKQVQVWLGHSDPGFTVRIYIHLMDDGLGDAAFLDELVKPGRGDDNAGVADEPDVADAAG